MILTTIKLNGRPAKRKEIIQTLRDLADRMKNEQGCLKAELYQDIEKQDTLYLMEEWRTRQDLDKYKKSRSLAVLLGLETLLVESLEIKHSVKFRSKKKTVQQETPGGTGCNEQNKSNPTWRQAQAASQRSLTNNEEEDG